MLARLYSLVLLTLFACSIVDDTAITSQNDIKKLKITGFEIDQQTNKGNKSISATLVRDSVINILDASTGNTLNRVVRYKLPPLPGLKMKLRSGTTAEVEISTTYIGSNKPYNVNVIQKDSLVERYRFRYDANGRLNKIVTFINPVDNKPELFITSDTLIYDFDVKTIIRRSSDVSREATINVGYSSGGFLSFTNLTYMGFNYQQASGSCGGSNPTGCGIYDFGPQSGGNRQSQIKFQTDESFTALDRIFLEDKKINNSGSCCRDFDTYYFHPLMLLRNQITKGDYLLLIYMMDWWSPGPVLQNSTSTYSKNEIVTLNFQYGL